MRDGVQDADTAIVPMKGCKQYTYGLVKPRFPILSRSGV